MDNICELSATELKRHLDAGELSSEDITSALIERRRALDPAINAFTQVNEEALEQAREADRARARGELGGPLHGIPVTIKDNLDVIGFDSTLGLRSRRGVPATSDAVLVRVLKDQGAIILGKTNVPQLLLAQETENEVFGVTVNPWDRTRVPGGSSGGEAAAIATGMSPLGIGTDIGGSIRVPSHFCGITGFKPTVNRWSNRGSQTGLPGQEIVRSQAGPMARTVEDLVLAWSALSPEAQAQLDPAVPPLPAPPVPEGVEGLRVGVYDSDDLLEPAPSLRRAVDRAKQALEAAGAILVPYEPTSSADVLHLWMAALSSDGGATLTRRLGGEKPSPQLRPSTLITKVPGPARKLLSSALHRFGEHRIANLLEVLGRKPVEELWRLAADRMAMRRRELDHWSQAQIDLLLCPAHTVPAIHHRKSGDFTLSVGPSARWNLLDFPAGTVPVTRVRADEESYPHADDKLDAKVSSTLSGAAGLPVGAQIVARPYCEHLALAAMQAVEHSVRTDSDHPRTPVAVEWCRR